RLFTWLRRAPSAEFFSDPPETGSRDPRDNEHVAPTVPITSREKQTMSVNMNVRRQTTQATQQSPWHQSNNPKQAFPDYKSPDYKPAPAPKCVDIFGEKGHSRIGG